MQKELIKISFVGDIMCEKPQLEASGKIGFNDMFINVKEYFKDSYVVGNLETPISNMFGYTNDLYCFNTPKNFLKSLKNANFDLLMTSNNHCLDRGIIGLNQTMKNIKKNKMDYVGTYLNKEEREKTKVININGVKVAFIAYTYGTNYGYTYYSINKKNEYKINLIKEQISDKTWQEESRFYTYVFWIKKHIKETIKKMIKYQSPACNFDTTKSVTIDELGKNEWEFSSEHIEKAIIDIKRAKEESDIVIFMLHSGGQFNAEPGNFTKSIMDVLTRENLNCIVGTHPHIVQKSEYLNNKFVAYSLGNFSISPSTPYINFELLPEYSILLNCYIDKKSKKIEKYSFSIFKAVEDENNYLRVYALKDLIDKEEDELKREKLIQDNLFIYNRFLNKEENKIELKLEYEI